MLRAQLTSLLVHQGVGNDRPMRVVVSIEASRSEVYHYEIYRSENRGLLASIELLKASIELLKYSAPSCGVLMLLATG
jgi:hypothetical protein